MHTSAMLHRHSAPAVAIAADNSWKLAQLREVLRRAQQAATPVIVLKGAAILDWLYEIGERKMADVDLLIHPEDADRFAQLIAGPEARARWALPDEPSSEFACELGGVNLDVHVALLNAGWLNSGTTSDDADLWARAERFEVLGVPALRLGPTDQLVHLAAHTVLHHLDWSAAGVEDIRRLLRAVQIDWHLLLDLARDRRVRTALWLVLSNEVVMNSVPKQVLRQLEPTRLGHLRVRIAQALWARGETTFAPMLLLDSEADALRAFLSRALPPQAWLRARYPSTKRAWVRRLRHIGRVTSRVVH